MKRQTSKSAIKGMFVAALLLVASALMLIYQAHHDGRKIHAAASSQPVNRASATVEDLKQLWEWTDGELQGGAASGSWHIRLDAEGLTEEQLNYIAQHFGIEWTGISRQGQKEYCGGTLSIWTASSEDSRDQITMVFRYEVQQDVREKVLLAAASELTHILDDQGVQGGLSFNVHGYSLRDDSGDRLAAAAGAQKKDSYKDRNTRSATWFSPAIEGFVELRGSVKGNLQIAVHKEAGGPAGTALIVGVPLITGDYSDIKLTIKDMHHDNYGNNAAGEE